MGNAAARALTPSSADELVDGGLLFPTGQVYAKTDCDLRVVRKCIKERRLAPFFRGAAEEQPTAPNECPICFLYFPSNTNQSRCCRQMICTECFLQIKQPTSGGPATCPYCVQPEFGVTYSPSSKKDANADSAEARKAVPHDAPEVVTIDHVRPNGRHQPPPPPQPQAETFGRRSTININNARGSARAARMSRRAGTGLDRFDLSADRPYFQTASRAFPVPTPQSQSTRTSPANATRERSYRSDRATLSSLLQAASFNERHSFGGRDVESEIDRMLLEEAIRLSLLEANGSVAGSAASTSSSASPPARTRLGLLEETEEDAGDSATARRLAAPRAAGEDDDEDDDDDDDGVEPYAMFRPSAHTLYPGTASQGTAAGSHAGF